MDKEEIERYKESYFDAETGLFSYPTMYGMTFIKVKDVAILTPLLMWVKNVIILQ